MLVQGVMPFSGAGLNVLFFTIVQVRPSKSPSKGLQTLWEQLEGLQVASNSAETVQMSPLMNFTLVRYY
jgi:hypothetical protein